jgi:FkbM family methyltransferase
MTKKVSDNSVLEFALIQKLVKKDNIVVDVGSNVGLYTKYLSDLVGINGKVISIEPIPYTFGILSHTVAKLKLNNVKLYNCAVSNQESFLNMVIPKNENGLEDYYLAKIIEPAKATKFDTVEVQTKTLDNILFEEGKISFIKCDVEGHEYRCLQGGVRVIENNKPALFIEIWEDLDEPNSAAHRTMIFLEEYGYYPYIYNKNVLRRRKIHETSNDYFFLTEEHITMLKHQSIILV